MQWVTGRMEIERMPIPASYAEDAKEIYAEMLKFAGQVKNEAGNKRLTLLAVKSAKLGKEAAEANSALEDAIRDCFEILPDDVFAEKYPDIYAEYRRPMDIESPRKK